MEFTGIDGYEVSPSLQPDLEGPLAAFVGGENSMVVQPFRKPRKSMDVTTFRHFSDHLKTFKYRLGSSFVTFLLTY